ncbi:phage holin [Streptococcus suis]|uniref:phage holin n=2 Tax=Streptococcus suis TaxID=1307 RepID=UPI00291C574F|nr:phage holin [Streptococcus suis]
MYFYTSKRSIDMKQIKNRLKKHMFWIGLISLVLMLVDNVLFCYFNIECSRTLNQIEQTICIILSILVFLGVLNNKPDVKVEDIIKTVCHLKINNNVCLETTDEVSSCTYSSVSLVKTDFSKYSQYFLKNYFVYKSLYL